VAAGAASAATFFLLSPFVILRLPTALEHMRANRQVVVDRSLSEGPGLFPSLGLYMEFLLEQARYLPLGARVAGSPDGSDETAASPLGGVSLMFLAFVSYTFFAGAISTRSFLPRGRRGVAVSRPRAVRHGGGAPLTAASSPSSTHSGRSALRSEDTRHSPAIGLFRISSGSTVALQSYPVPLPQSEEASRAWKRTAPPSPTGKANTRTSCVRRGKRILSPDFSWKGEELNRITGLRNSLVGSRSSARGVTAFRHPPIPPPPE
jgi:hypothetical protein